MSNSTFNVTEPYSNDSITLIVGTDGSVSPRKEIVKQFLSTRQSVDINLMTMKKVEAGTVNVMLDNYTFVNNMEETDEEMDDIARNLVNIRMDHDYTPLTSPEHTVSGLDLIDDELAQTLSMMEGGTLPPRVQISEPLTKITKIVKGKKQTIFVNSKQKAKMISTGQLKEVPSETVFKKPKPLEVQKPPPKPVKSPAKPEIKIVEVLPAPPLLQAPEEEEEDFEDDEYLNDLDEDDENDSDFELEEEQLVRKKPVSRKMRTRNKSESKSRPEKPKKRSKSTEKVEPEVSKPPEIIPPVEEVKKPVPKKEKKIPKPMPDDFALFSTPDIIRRVGKDTASPEKPLPKPQKLSPEIRSKSSETKSKRLSTDYNKSPEKTRRLSLDTRKSDKTEQVSVQEFTENMNNSNESIPTDQLEPLPSAEDIRAIIQNENTKSFTTSLVIPDSHEEDQSGAMSLDTNALDLDQSILDNIATDLIPEDILFQVAQSLVDNTDLQNAIDKSINDGNLVLDPAMADAALLDGVNASMNSQSIPNSEHIESTSKSGTHIVRPDGRVVVIPPIERPATRSRNRNKKEVSPIRQPKQVKKPLDEEHVSGNELDSSEDDEDESEDDPNKLWCICNQPHNNRFMICCDTCEEWYHGKCVNVSKSMGQMMEQQGKEWICVYCKDTSLKRPKAAARRIRKASRTSTDSGGGGGSPKKMIMGGVISSSSSSVSVSEDKPNPPGCVVCSKPSRNSSIYCSDTCILKHAQGVEKVVVFDRKRGKLLSGNDAPNAANIDKWLADNPTYEVVRSMTSKASTSKPKMTQSNLRLVKNSTNDGISLAVQKKGVNIGILPHAPKDNKPKPPSALTIKKKIPGLKVVNKQVMLNQQQSKAKVASAQPVTPKAVPSTSTPAKPKLVQTKIITTTSPVVKEKERPLPQKTPKARQAEVGQAPPKQENLRDTVKKTFFEQLSNRLQAVEDLKISDDELKSISNEIESQLYKCFGDTGQKYKNKYRSLIFNIKDNKNQTLWRRICEKSVNPYQLVRLSPDDLASQELALWREREAKHQLDMIKKSELELLNCSRQYVFKTHKGEQVFEDDRPKDQVTEVISDLGADSTVAEKEEDSKESREKRGSSKHSKRNRSRDRDRSRSSRDGKVRRKDDHKKRSHSREHRHGDRRRSRSRDRYRKSSHKTARHKKDDKTISTEKLDKKSKEILEQLVDKHIVPPLEDRLWKHVPQEDIIPTPTIESDSDHEPSSTVTIPTPPRNTEPEESTPSKEKDVNELEESEGDDDSSRNSPLNKLMTEPIWKGMISMIDVAQISITAHEVSGDCSGLGEALPSTLDIVGRISPETVWDYIGKMKSSNSKTISVIRLTAINMEERMPYLALYSYLSSRNRLGVVKSVTKAIKDFYVLPLAAHTPIPDPLLPISGPGFEDSRPALLLGVLVRDKRKRSMDTPTHIAHKRVRVDVIIAPPSTPPSSSRSYTPPPNRDPRVKVSSVPLPVPSQSPDDEPEEDMDEPYSPEDSDPETLPEMTNSRLNADDISNLLTGSMKSSSFLESGIHTKTFEPFNNKFDSIPGLDESPVLISSSTELERTMAALDQAIAAQKAEISKVSQDIVSSAANSSEIGSTALASIALPSNLQQILESIKTIGSKTDSIDSQGENSNSSVAGLNTDLTIPLMLPKIGNRQLKTSSSLPKSIPPSLPEITIPLNLPKPKSKVTDLPEKTSVLSSLSEEDLIKKAAEMLGENETQMEQAPLVSPLKKARLDFTQPPIPGLEDD